MSLRKTHEQFLLQTEDLPITILGRYTGGRQRIEISCDKCGHEWAMRVDHVVAGKGCPECLKIKQSKAYSKSQEVFSAEMKELGVTVIGEYKNRDTCVRVSCDKCGNIWSMRPGTSSGICKCLWKRRGTVIPEIENDHGDWVEIRVPSGELVAIDASDYELIDRSVYLEGHGYPVIKVDGMTAFIHKLIMPKENALVDHIDRDPLNNRRSNLRYVTRSQNAMNSKFIRNTKTGIRGVTYNKGKKKWEANIYVNRKRIQLGRYDNIDFAVGARNQAEIEYFGEYRPDAHITEKVEESS